MPSVYELLSALGAVAKKATPPPTTGGGSVRELVIQACYLAASVLFILGLRGLTRPEKARRACNWPPSACSWPSSAP